MFIDDKRELKDAMLDKVILITGAGGGIGLEAAKTFCYMGAKVIIAEISKERISSAKKIMENLFSKELFTFYKVDLSKESNIRYLFKKIMKTNGCPDVIFNNATMIAMGNVEEVPINIWKKSFDVNFKAPLLLTQLSLPEMKKRNSGTIVFVPSSGAAPYMGAYEVFKTSQVELCNTLTGELENTNIHTFSIGPGLVKTETALKGIEIVSKKMGLTLEQFFAMNDSHILGVEEAGCGFAVATLYAEKYNGMEIGSIQVLLDNNLLKDKDNKEKTIEISDILVEKLFNVIKIFKEQYNGWISRNVFEKQWIMRDFKKTIGISTENFLNDMEHLESELHNKNYNSIINYKNNLSNLEKYYRRQYKLLQGFERNPIKLKESSNILLNWIAELSQMLKLF